MAHAGTGRALESQRELPLPIFLYTLFQEVYNSLWSFVDCEK
jgi:hypothetical protein